MNICIEWHDGDGDSRYDIVYETHWEVSHLAINKTLSHVKKKCLISKDARFGYKVLVYKLLLYKLSILVMC